MGHRDNLIEGLQLKPTFADYVLQLRRQLVHAGQIGDVNPQVCFDLKKQLEFSWGIPYASVGQIYQIAKVANEVEWSLHEQLLRGDVKPMQGSKASRKRGDKTVPANQATSANYSVGLGNLSQEDRINVLSRLRNGEIDCAGCKVECDRLKAMHHVREEILKLANFVKKGNRKTSEVPFPSWAVLKDKVPRCATSAFVDTWVNLVIRTKGKVVVSGERTTAEKKPQLDTNEAFKKAVTDIVSDFQEARVVRQK